jgi:hypothetical protein
MQYLRCTQKCEYLIDTARLKILFSEAINISYFEYPQNVRTHAHTLICIGGCASLLKLLWKMHIIINKRQIMHISSIWTHFIWGIWELEKRLIKRLLIVIKTITSPCKWSTMLQIYSIATNMKQYTSVSNPITFKIILFTFTKCHWWDVYICWWICTIMVVYPHWITFEMLHYQWNRHTDTQCETTLIISL